jgi:hypothetical protein
VRPYFAAISLDCRAISEASGTDGTEMPAPAMMKNGDLRSSVSSRACLISEIAVARSISCVVPLPSGEGESFEIIAHALLSSVAQVADEGARPHLTAASRDPGHSGKPRLLLNQRPSVGWLFFWRDHYRCGHSVPGFDVQQADALG